MLNGNVKLVAHRGCSRSSDLLKTTVGKFFFSNKNLFQYFGCNRISHVWAPNYKFNSVQIKVHVVLIRSQSVSQSVSQPVSQSVRQTYSPSVRQSVSLSDFFGLSVTLSFNPSLNQSIIRLDSQQSVSQSVS